MAPQPDNQPASGLATNDFDLTDAERLAQESATDNGGGDPAAATPPAADPAQPAASADPAAAPAAATPDPAAATPPAADPPAAATPGAPTQAPVQPFVANLAPDNRDFDAELKVINDKIAALKAQRGAGELDQLSDDEYEQQLDTLKDQRTDLRVEQNTARIKTEISQQTADQAWVFLQDQFFADPNNLPIRQNAVLFAAWEAAMQEVANDAAREGKQLTDWSLMVDARTKLVAQGIPLPGGTTAPPPPAQGGATGTPAAPPAQPKPDRTPPLANVPTTLGSAPSAAAPGTAATADAMAEMGNIEDLEAALAGKSEADRDAILRGVPGTFVDH